MYFIELKWGGSEVLGGRAGVQPGQPSLASSIIATGFMGPGTLSGLCVTQLSLQTSSPLC